jgi:hypothetical protein
MEYIEQGQSTFRKLTVSEAVERAQLPCPRGANASYNNDKSWAGEHWDDAVKMALDGDPESARGLRKYLGVLARVRQGNRTVARWGESGGSVDVGRFLAGDPECMIESVRARRPAPVTRIAIERAVSANISQMEMRATGASVLAVTEALRTAGVPAEIWVTFSLRGHWGADYHSTQVLVQEAGRPIDLDVLAFWVANPAAFRRLGFALEEQEPEEVRDRMGFYNDGGYGGPDTPKNKEDFDEVTPANSSGAERWIAEVLSRRAGLELRREDY